MLDVQKLSVSGYNFPMGLKICLVSWTISYPITYPLKGEPPDYSEGS